ncbi:MAG: hypothetical protein CMM52_14370 [Rhodospirillaceae bacterium]|nr:hypothetical protein [Rhodospirillaceae bacterium]|tara:strand:- start:13656 stop:14090 length:435 start_codon:yes stop_codon:yes gene_type:complete
MLHPRSLTAIPITTLFLLFVGIAGASDHKKSVIRFVPTVGSPIELNSSTVASAAALKFSKNWTANNPTQTGYYVSFDFTKKGDDAYFRMTKENIGKRFRLTLHGRTIIDPIVRDAGLGGVVILNSMTKKEAEAIRDALLLPPSQ